MTPHQFEMFTPATAVTDRLVERRAVFKKHAGRAEHLLRMVESAGVDVRTLERIHPANWHSSKAYEALSGDREALAAAEELRKIMREAHDHGIQTLQMHGEDRAKRFFDLLRNHYWPRIHRDLSMGLPALQNHSRLSTWLREHPGAIEWHLGISPHEISTGELNDAIGKPGRLSSEKIRQAFRALIEENVDREHTKKDLIAKHSAKKWNERPYWRQRWRDEHPRY